MERWDLRTAVTLPSGVVTFLLSDVEGSTRLWEGDESAAAAAIARHYELLGAAIALHGGVRPEEQGEGDSVVGAFARPSDALAAALAAQLAFAEEAWPGGTRLRIRMALHTGETRLRDEENYAGRTVIRCARLRAVAHGGQTLVSAATRDLVADRLPEGASLRDLGWHRLKDLGAPERVWQLCHPELPDDFAPLRSLDACAANLPVQLTTFVGRDAELAEVCRVLDSVRLLTLTGAGGAGKTRLALHALADVADRFADGIWWVELAPLADPELLPFAVARAVGLRAEEGRPVLDTLCERLAGVDGLLALDNCEHMTDVCAAFVDRLLRAAPGLRVLATSREPLVVPGEVTWRVPPLDADAAARLFVDRASQVRPGFVPDAGEAAAIASVCRRLDGIPLAIELAAARVRMMSPPAVADALDDRFRLLTGGGRTALARQQTLETSVAWSHDLLAPDERVLFRRLSAFAGGFGLPAAEAVCAGPPLDRYAVLDLLARLVDKSLVHVEHEADDRYQLLETIRLYAAQRLVEAREGDAVRNAHLTYFRDVAEAAELQIVRATGTGRNTDQDALLDRQVADLGNMRAAFAWGLGCGRAEDALRIATALYPVWRIRGRRAEGSAWLDEALEAAGEVQPDRRLRALIARSRLPDRANAAGAARVDEAVALARELGDRRQLARALVGGVAYVSRGPAEWGPLVREAAAIAEELGDPEALADAHLRVAIVAAWGGETGEAVALGRTALDVASTCGNTYAYRATNAILGFIHLMRGEALVALPLVESAAAEALRSGDVSMRMYSLGNVAWGQALTGQEAAARQTCAAGLALSGRGERAHDALLRLGWGHAALVSGDAAEAFAALTAGRELADDSPGYGDLFAGAQAEALLAMGDVDRARRFADDAVARSTDPPLRWQAAWARQARARVALAEGQTARADDLAHQALALRLAVEDTGGAADSLDFLALLAYGRGAGAEAARLLAAADAARAAVGCRRYAVHAAEAALAGRVREALGEDAFAEAWAQGTALSLPDAVSYAARGRGERRRPASGWEALTPAELSVARLVADGLRNKEIAERLFVSPRTVQAHLASVFTKLDLTSRVQLAQVVSRRPAGPPSGGSR